MKLEEFREDTYRYFSGKASDRARSLVLGGLAVVWIFRTGQGAESKLPGPLLAPLSSLAIALALDLLHYVVPTLVWGIWCRVQEWEGRQDCDLKAPAWINWPTISLFWLKIVAMVIAYVLIGRFLWSLWAAG